MPRHVVTLSPRSLRPLLWSSARKRDTKRTIREELEGRYRPRYRQDGVIELDFSTRDNLRSARERVGAELDVIAPEWRKLFVLYPTEAALRSKGY